VTVTAYFLQNAAKLFFCKYITALSDYIGRKPILILSCAAFILSRILVLSATNASLFYVAAICVGSMDVFYAASVAYISDILSSSEEALALRGKAIGVQTGLSVGLGFTIGVPVGAVLQSSYSLQTPFYVAIASSLASVVCCLLIKHSDTTGVVHDDKQRRFPRDWAAFSVAHSPLSGFSLIRTARDSPLDWLTNYCSQVAQQILQSIFILFVEAALGYSPAQAGEAFAIIGLSIAIFSPLLIGRYEERGLISLGQCGQIVGYLFLSLSGIPDAQLGALAFPGFLFLAVGSVWMSAMPSILTKQYPPTQYGSVVGVMAQQTVLAVFPAYPLSLLFSFTMQKDTTIPWPGFTWVFCAFSLLAAILVQVVVHPSKALRLIRRVVAVTPEDEKKKEGEGEKKDPIPEQIVVSPLFEENKS